MDHFSGEFLVGLAIGLAINLISTFLADSIPQPVRRGLGKWSWISIAAGLFAFGSACAVLGAHSWYAPVAVTIYLAGVCTRRWARCPARQTLSRAESEGWRSRHRQGWAAELSTVVVLGALACLVMHQADADLQQALREGETWIVWVWTVLLVPISITCGLASTFLAWQAGFMVSTRRPIPG